MTRSLWTHPAVLIPVVMIAIGLAARYVAVAMHVDPHANAMALAIGINIIAGELAIIPMAMSRGAAQVTIVQAGLLASVIQMFIAAVLSGVALYALHGGQPFVLWIIPMYWIGLGILVAGLISAIRRSVPLQTKATSP